MGRLKMPRFLPQTNAAGNVTGIFERLVIPTGIEPVTYRLGICRSILLSYGTSRGDT